MKSRADAVILVVAGGRRRPWSVADEAWLASLKPDVILTGHYGITDNKAREWARENGIPTGDFMPNWRVHDRAAGPIRNNAMALCATHAAIFNGGRGTAHMLEKAKEMGLTVYLKGEG